MNDVFSVFFLDYSIGFHYLILINFYHYLKTMIVTINPPYAALNAGTMNHEPRNVP